MPKQQITQILDTRFSCEEMDAAETEMHRDHKTLSSIQRAGLTIGLTTNKTGTQWFSGYYPRFCPKEIIFFLFSMH